MRPDRWDAQGWADANFVLEARAGWACERCGKECGPVERHHRKRRREGGDYLSNLILVGRECHREIHAHPVESRRLGFIVSMSRNPADIPVMWRRHEWMSLDNEGNKTPLPAIVDAHEDAPVIEGEPGRL